MNPCKPDRKQNKTNFPHLTRCRSPPLFLDVVILKFKESGTLAYFVTIKDYYGKELSVKVSSEIYQVYNEGKKAKERERYERRKHLDRRSLEDFFDSEQLVVESLEDFYFKREKLRALFEFLQKCTPLQRKRFYLNRICGYSTGEIAGMEGCRKQAVEKSIRSVCKKIKIFLQTLNKRVGF
jgi:RNA polymerase sigma-70 factor (ECF subfamily)